MSKKSYILLFVAAIASLLVSCGSSKNTGRHSYRHGGSGDSRTFEIPKSLPPQSHALLTEAKSWIGTPYRYGGDDKRGVDCSGFVLKVYKARLISSCHAIPPNRPDIVHRYKKSAHAGRPDLFCHVRFQKKSLACRNLCRRRQDGTFFIVKRCHRKRYLCGLLCKDLCRCRICR